MKDNTLFLLGGGLVVYYLMSKPAKKETSKIEEETKETEKEAQKQNYSFNPGGIKGSITNPNVNNPKSSQFGLISNGGSLNGSSNNSLNLLNNPNSPKLGNIGTFGLKSNPISAYNQIIVKKVATPGYFYKVSINDSMYPDPLIKIAVVAYGLMNIPDNVMLSYARQLNANEYNIRFQHFFSNDYAPYNKKIDTAPVYGTLKQQFEDNTQGSYMKGNNFPYLYIPVESEFV